MVLRVHSGRQLYKLVKKVEDDPMFEPEGKKKNCAAMLGATTFDQILKARSWLTTFMNRYSRREDSGQASNGGDQRIERAIQYYHAIKTYLVERKSPY